jgi:hypothetical protein
MHETLLQCRESRLPSSVRPEVSKGQAGLVAAVLRRALGLAELRTNGDHTGRGSLRYLRANGNATFSLALRYLGANGSATFSLALRYLRANGSATFSLALRYLRANGSATFSLALRYLRANGHASFSLALRYLRANGHAESRPSRRSTVLAFHFTSSAALRATRDACTGRSCQADAAELALPGRRRRPLGGSGEAASGGIFKPPLRARRRSGLASAPRPCSRCAPAARPSARGARPASLAGAPA